MFGTYQVMHLGLYKFHGSLWECLTYMSNVGLQDATLRYNPPLGDGFKDAEFYRNNYRDLNLDWEGDL
jgi:hypothetical protein